MKHLSVLLLFLCLSAVGYSQMTGGIGVIPAPQHVRMTGGRFGTRTVLYNYDPFPTVGDTAVKGGEGGCADGPLSGQFGKEAEKIRVYRGAGGWRLLLFPAGEGQG